MTIDLYKDFPYDHKHSKVQDAYVSIFENFCHAVMAKVRPKRREWYDGDSLTQQFVHSVDSLMDKTGIRAFTTWGSSLHVFVGSHTSILPTLAERDITNLDKIPVKHINLAFTKLSNHEVPVKD